MVFKRDLEFDRQWNKLLVNLEKITGKKPTNVSSVLFLIGVQELGKGPVTFTKEEKQDLLHIAICKVLSFEGYYELEGIDADGWPHWKSLKKIPSFNSLEQEKFLKMTFSSWS